MITLEQEVQQTVPIIKSNTVTEPIPSVNTPLFPAISLHIIYREFIHQNPQITTFAEMETPFKAYLESRLLTLYPETAYVGMIDEAFAEGKAYQQAYETYVTANNIIEEEEATLRTTIPTLEDEIEATGMTTEEIQTWNNWEQYATATKLVSRTQLDALAQQYKSGQKNWQNVFYFASSILYSGYVVYRAYQARSRAYAARTNYYTSGASGTKGDAFRHIYASMHLRRYVGSWVAQLVGWANEVRNPNQCHDREMDFHNNRVGYSTRYTTFRNGTSRHDYGRWGRRVRDFVNNSGANGTLQSGWNWSATNPLNCTTVDNDVANTSNNRYIYYMQ